MQLTRSWLRLLSFCFWAILLIGVLPNFALACGCGPACQCGASCDCYVAYQPPPPTLNANPVRRNQASLSASERRDFVRAVKALKHTFRPSAQISIYDEFVQMHVMAMHEGRIHNGPAFFPWHRQFLRYFEMELQAINPNVSLPYWDFTVDNTPQSRLWAKDFLGGNGDPLDFFIVKTGPFRQGLWIPVFDGPDLHRNFGGFQQINLPTPKDLARAYLVPFYDVKPFDENCDVSFSFRNYMTGWNHPSGEAEMHNRVHEWMGGSMMSVASPNDPVFWLAHAFLDRNWYEWQAIYGRQYPRYGAPFGHNLYDPMPIFATTPASVLDHHALGYYYDVEK